ncbi:protein of unknown function (plasmid) [Pararobbsia alpina]
MIDFHTPTRSSEHDGRSFADRFAELLSTKALINVRFVDPDPFRPLFSGVVDDETLRSIVRDASAILIPESLSASLLIGVRMTQIWFVLRNGFVAAGEGTEKAHKRAVQLIYRLGSATTGYATGTIYLYCRAFGLFAVCPELLSVFPIWEIGQLLGKRLSTLQAAVLEKQRNPSLSREELRELVLRLESTTVHGA